MSRIVFLLCFVGASMLATTAFPQSFLSQYKGLPYHDSRYQGGPQKISGRVLLAHYDLGGKVVPPAELLYVGWTEPGEWFNVTVDVTDAGTYATDFLYTSNRGGTISVDVNGKDATGPVQIASTNDPADRWPGANGITGIWLRSFSTFDSAKGRMSLPFTS
jgi:hypothetical protein